jgi:hypothetical protein
VLRWILSGWVGGGEEEEEGKGRGMKRDGVWEKDEAEERRIGKRGKGGRGKGSQRCTFLQVRNTLFC